ncbi:MAG: hypothetical protein OEZ16_03825 [Chromatiales bacterium]|nr:hypothetical protein [Chromatiales bacterium]
MNRYYSLLLLAPFTAPAFAADPPSPAEVRKVMQYYQDGSDVMLVESKFCTEVEKAGDNKNECAEEINATTIEEGSRPLVWMNFFVPGSDSANVLIQFKHKGKALKSDEMSLSNAIRYRTWKSLPTSKTGPWEIAVEQETAEGYRPVTTLSYSVVEKVERAE